MISVAALAACKEAPQLPSVISPYRIDIQQGNVVTQEMVSKLKVGLTRSQVRFVLGTPLVVDAFRTDRWDYVYLLQRQGKPDERRRLTVLFEEDKLVRMDGDVALVEGGTAEAKPVAKPAAPKPAAAAKPVEDSTVIVVNPAGAQNVPPPAVAKPETAADAAKADAGKADDNKGQEKQRGFFGKMLEKVGL